MRLAVFVSGAGSNLLALLSAAERNDLGAGRIVVVVSNRPEAPALAHAQARGLATIALDHKRFPTRESFDAALLAALAPFAVDAIVLAGFMRILGADFVAHFPQRILNTHPSLLPAFPGAHAIADALAYGVKVTGVTVHFVDSTLDGGAVIAQAPVAVVAGDTVDSLRARIQAVEHTLLPRVVAALANNELCVAQRIVTRTKSGSHGDTFI